MSPDTIGALGNAAIPFFAGIYLTLMAHRIVGKKPGESQQFDEWIAKYGNRMKYIGPIMISFGVFLAVKGIVLSK